MKSKNPLIGNWILISYELINGNQGNQSTQYPFGKDPIGYLFYTDTGRMYGTLMAENRTPFTSKDYMKGTLEEKALAMDTFISYCGTYEIQGDRVIHHVEVSWYPNWTQRPQERFFKIKGDQLILSTKPFQVDGLEQTAQLVWRKI